MARRLVRPRERSELKNIPYEIFIGLLSVLSIVNLVLVFVFVDDPAMQTVLRTMTGVFTLVFFIDFLYRLTTAPSRADYFLRDFGWADLLASLPAPQLNILRGFRLYRVFRLFRRLGARRIWRTLARDRANSALMLLLLAGVLVLQFGSLGVLWAEQTSADANITTAGDALWYTLVTISTVGYGDQYPVTLTGRLVGALIIIVGVGIFGTFTGYLANFFLAPRTRRDGDAGGPVPAGQTGEDAGRAAQLRSLLARTEASAAELRRLLSEEEGRTPEDDDGPRGNTE